MFLIGYFQKINTKTIFLYRKKTVRWNDLQVELLTMLQKN